YGSICWLFSHWFHLGHFSRTWNRDWILFSRFIHTRWLDWFGRLLTRRIPISCIFTKTMKQNYFVHPFVDTGLGNSAYLIGSHESKKAVLIDPLRDVDRYLHTAQELGLTITHVLDTHLHADFISGNREIAQQTSAIIGASATAQLAFDHSPLTENSLIDLGSFQIQVM